MIYNIQVHLVVVELIPVQVGRLIRPAVHRQLISRIWDASGRYSYQQTNESEYHGWNLISKDPIIVNLTTSRWFFYSFPAFHKKKKLRHNLIYIVLGLRRTRYAFSITREILLIRSAASDQINLKYFSCDLQNWLLLRSGRFHTVIRNLMRRWISRSNRNHQLTFLSGHVSRLENVHLWNYTIDQ